MTHEEMKATYARKSASHTYLYGFTVSDRLYYILLSWQELGQLLKNDRAAASKGGMLKVRVKGTAKVKAAFVESGKAVELGKADMLNWEDQFNRGEHFERIVTEKLTGETWVKDSVPFWVAGDIRLDGEEVQIKFDGAELTNERAVNKLLALG